MHAPKFSVGESISFGWNGMKKYFWFFFVLSVASLVVSILMRSLPVFKDMGIVGTIATSIGVFITVCIGVATMMAQLAVSHGKNPSYAFLKPRLLLWFKLLLAYIITGTVQVLGFILLVIPGIYISVKLQFVFYAVIEHGHWPFQAIGYSWKVTRSHWWDLLLFFLATLGVNILGFICLLVGLFASVATTRIAHAHIYQRLSDGVNSHAFQGSKNKYIFLRTLEILLCVLLVGGAYAVLKLVQPYTAL